MGSLWSIAASLMAAAKRIVIADIVFGIWGPILAYWPFILIGLIILVIVLIERMLKKRDKKQIKEKDGDENA